MKKYNLINNLLGWFSFAVAAVTYCLTVEPTASFWDCPEFITTAYKLEVGHPPGAPFFMLTGNFFTQFTDDPTKVAFCVNIMSALLSALCILFLFWSITHLARKLICKDGVVTSLSQLIVIMGSGLTGALAYTWSDTFWFSAVEGEVYAYSSMFTALVFWLILKWEDHADEPHSDRWLVLIFYLTGLSIGVHLLNLLCLPAITLVYYYKRYPSANLKGSLVALGVSMLLVAAVLYGVVPGIVKVGGWFELFFVNSLGMPFNTGVVIYLIVLIGVVLAAIWSTTQKNRVRTQILYVASIALLGIPFMGHGALSVVCGLLVLGALYFVLTLKNKDGNFILRKRFLNTSLLCMLMLMIGYSSYAIIVIRSTQNTPMDQNSPEDIFTLGTYMGREQYGSYPLFKGEAYCSQGQAYAAGAIEYEKRMRTQRKEKATPDEPDQYEEIEETVGVNYPSELTMLFPRMWSAGHTAQYQEWMGDIEMNEGYMQTPDGYEVPVSMPTQLENIRFFLSYQVNFMYWRYFMWNFAGRQNDIQSKGFELEHGNWISGIPFIDNALYGDQSLLPDALSKDNKGHNVFYCLPLLLGLIGLFWQSYRGEKGVRQFWVVFFLFFMTGLAIVLYLNQTPSQPRERDYAYAGSFYAFAIWIGLGVAALASLFEKLLKKPVLAAAVASLAGICVPLQMVSQTWDDHDRSGRYACRDFGLNYLNTLPEKGNPIIFTNGDNDTFPLWYNQEVEGQRTDARVCNLSYLQTDWYTDQMKRPAYDSPALPITWERICYVDNGKHAYYPIRAEEKVQLDALKKTNPEVDPYELSYILKNYVCKESGGYFPTDSVVVSVNKEAVRESGMYLPFGPDSIPDKMIISLKNVNERQGGLYRADVMVYEMLAHADWKRPMYMSVTLGSENYASLENFCVLEGLAYRITPFNFGGRGVVDEKLMMHNFMERFKYGNMSQPGLYIDETVSRMCRTHRRMFVMLADRLVRSGKKDDAAKVLARCEKELPACNIPYTDDDSQLASLWAEVGNAKEAERVAKAVLTYNLQYFNYLNSLSASTIESYRSTNYYLFASTIEALQALGAAKSKEEKAFRNKVEKLYDTPAFNSGMSTYYQQMGG
ncbi:DUF2723 domain-containing protein [Prevotellamassilia timonensis]|uniref:DUF2723 domain-containing protein n=1 Tax=Prevotellamassilia timonensis TaxID=1852370 RepID=UPI001F2AB550|nr:DUF2723 domain-containing protein [Prevotellamassilia timonensis]MCF2633888.1 DUF2723 domain-containing protein [Prevotellamassilia timonensis]